MMRSSNVTALIRSNTAYLDPYVSTRLFTPMMVRTSIRTPEFWVYFQMRKEIEKL